MLKALTEKVDNMHGWVDTFSRDMETIKMKILEKNNSVTEMKNAFKYFTSRFEVGEEPVSLKMEIDQQKLHKVKHKEKKKEC